MLGSVVSTHKYTVAPDPSRTHSRLIFSTTLPLSLRPLGLSRVNNPASLPFRRRPGGTDASLFSFPPSSPFLPHPLSSLILFLSLFLLLVLSSSSEARGAICSARISRLQTAEACKTRGCTRKWNLLFARCAKNTGMLRRSAGQQAVCGSGDGGGGGGVTR